MTDEQHEIKNEIMSQWRAETLVWKRIFGISVMVIGVLLSVNGWLVNKGFDTINEATKNNHTAIEEIKKTNKTTSECLQQKLDQHNTTNKSRDNVLIRRMDRLEILITMPFSKRMEVLRNLSKVIQNNDKLPEDE